MVQADAHIQASDLTITGLQYVGLEVCGAESTVTVARGTLDSFLPTAEVDARFLDAREHPSARRSVVVHSHSIAELS